MTLQEQTARAAATPGLTVRIARSVEEVEELRGSWLAGTNITTDPDYFLTVVVSRSSAERPHVLVVERDGDVVTMLVARLERMPIHCRIGYWTVWEPRLRTIVVVHDGLLGEATAEVTGALLESLRGSLANGTAEAVYMHGVRVDSPLHAATESVPGLRRQGGIEQSVHHRLNLPGTFDDFMQTRNTKSRGSIRRYSRRLEETFEGELELRVYDDVADLETVVRDLETVASTTYQRGLGVGFEGTPFVRRLLRLTMERGVFRAWVLYVQGVPVAFWQGYLSGGALRTDYTGFDPTYTQHRVGTYVLLRVIADCCENDDVRAIDFGIGDAEYKDRFGNEHWVDADVLLYGRGLHLWAVNAARSATTVLNRALAALARRSGTLRRLKRGWRRRLATP